MRIFTDSKFVPPSTSWLFANVIAVLVLEFLCWIPEASRIIVGKRALFVSTIEGVIVVGKSGRATIADILSDARLPSPLVRMMIPRRDNESEAFGWIRQMFWWMLAGYQGVWVAFWLLYGSRESLVGIPLVNTCVLMLLFLVSCSIAVACIAFRDRCLFVISRKLRRVSIAAARTSSTPASKIRKVAEYIGRVMIFILMFAIAANLAVAAFETISLPWYRIAEGRVVNASVSLSKGRRYFNVEYRYSVNGKQYISRHSGGWFHLSHDKMMCRNQSEERCRELISQYRPGSPVSVHYNPVCNAMSYITSSSSPEFLALGMGCVALVGAVFILAGVIDRHKERR